MQRAALNKLTIYRNVVKDQLVGKAIVLLEVIDSGDLDIGHARELYHEILCQLVEEVPRGLLEGHLWQNYLLNLLIEAENTFSLLGEKIGSQLKGQLYSLALLDLEVIVKLYDLDWEAIREKLGFAKDFSLEDFPSYMDCTGINKAYLDTREALKEGFTDGDAQRALDALLAYYQQYGCGSFARYRAFRWERDRGLRGIENSDAVELGDLVGYQYQKDILTKNTEAFLRGSRANNVLLFGDKGTGKSSSVKALANKYFSQGLRLIELSKENIVDFPKILEKVKNRGLKFIVFLDDLSFEEFEVEYKHIKAIIEGGLEAKPQNLLIYATSNRRHLIKESWLDQKNSGEIRISDSVQEKLSLVDRFGITITFGTPDQEEYLKIVEELAKVNGLNLSREELHHRALQWELWYHGRSGRTAQQFINHLLGEAGK